MIIAPRHILLALLGAGLLGADDNKSPRIDEVEKQLLEATNEFRKKEDRGPLKADPKLEKTARDFAGFMARTDKYGHEADDSEPQQRAKAHGYEYCVIAENIAYQFNSEGFTTRELADKYIEGWIHSPGHRKNMLDPDVTEAGMGVAHSEKSDKYYAVQVFGRPQSAAFEFAVANETDEEIEYTLDGEKRKLPARTTRTHEVCRPVTLVFSWNKTDGKPEELRPRPDERFEIRKRRNQFRLARKPAPERQERP
jgi:hypothetical protein